MFSLLALAALVEAAPHLGAVPMARLAMHHASYRDCARRRPRHPQPTPTLDSCASITATWPTVVEQPGITAHLQRRVLSLTGQPAARPLATADAPANLRQSLHSQDGFAQETFAVSAVVNRPGLLVLQNKWTHDGGGAHPDQGVQYYTYDTARDQVLTLADLLVAGYAPRLLPLVQQAFRQQPGARLRSPARELPLTANFVPTSQGLRFHYNAGEAGAVAAGPMDVQLSWQQLKPLLRPATLARTW